MRERERGGGEIGIFNNFFPNRLFTFNKKRNSNLTDFSQLIDKRLRYTYIFRISNNFYNHTWLFIWQLILKFT